jgi:hypothetical protein
MQLKQVLDKVYWSVPTRNGEFDTESIDFK